MANYVVKEMPAGLGNGKKGRILPKMQVYTEINYDKVVALINIDQFSGFQPGYHSWRT